jgi:hypothetical protein
MRDHKSISLSVIVLVLAVVLSPMTTADMMRDMTIEGAMAMIPEEHKELITAEDVGELYDQGLTDPASLGAAIQNLITQKQAAAEAPKEVPSVEPVDVPVEDVPSVEPVGSGEPIEYAVSGIPKTIPPELIDAGAEAEFIGILCQYATINTKRFIDTADFAIGKYEDASARYPFIKSLDAAPLEAKRTKVLDKIEVVCSSDAANYYENTQSLVGELSGADALGPQLQGAITAVTNDIISYVMSGGSVSATELEAYFRDFESEIRSVSSTPDEEGMKELNRLYGEITVKVLAHAEKKVKANKNILVEEGLDTAEFDSGLTFISTKASEASTFFATNPTEEARREFIGAMLKEKHGVESRIASDLGAQAIRLSLSRSKRLGAAADKKFGASDPKGPVDKDIAALRGEHDALVTLRDSIIQDIVDAVAEHYPEYKDRVLEDEAEIEAVLTLFQELGAEGKVVIRGSAPITKLKQLRASCKSLRGNLKALGVK